MNNKDMIVYKESFITKAINFFKKIFKIKDKENKDIFENKEKDSLSLKKDFKENIVIKEDREKIELLKLQKSYKDAEIFEEDIPKDKKEKLIELYKKQNEEMKNKIQQEKVEIKKILDSLKAS